MREFMTCSSLAALGSARPKTRMPHPGFGDEAKLPRSHVPREPGGNWHQMIRLFPDPVVVASAGPLPSATLHEIRLVLARMPGHSTIRASRRRVKKEISSPYAVLFHSGEIRRQR